MNMTKGQLSLCAEICHPPTPLLSHLHSPHPKAIYKAALYVSFADMTRSTNAKESWLCWRCLRASCSTHQIVYEVGEGPDHGHAGEGNAEQDDVQETDAQDVRQPHSSAVHHSGVGVHLAVCRAHIHDGTLLMYRH